MAISDTVTNSGPQHRPDDRLTAAEFFAGIGLVRLALMHQGWRVDWANDIDADKAEMYHANFGSSDFVLGDVARKYCHARSRHPIRINGIIPYGGLDL